MVEGGYVSGGFITGHEESSMCRGGGGAVGWKGGGVLGTQLQGGWEGWGMGGNDGQYLDIGKISLW